MDTWYTNGLHQKLLMCIWYNVISLLWKSMGTWNNDSLQRKLPMHVPLKTSVKVAGAHGAQSFMGCKHVAGT